MAEETTGGGAPTVHDQLSPSERSASWRRRFLLRERLAGSLVFVPVLWIVAALVLGRVIPGVEGERDLLGMKLDPDTARTALSAIVSGMIAFTGLVVSVAVVVVTFGASQYTPRLVNRFRRDPAVKHALGIFAAPAVFALVSMRNIGRDGSTVVPSLTVAVNVVLLVAALIAFFGLVSRLLDLLRPRRVIAQVVGYGEAAIHEAYPFPFEGGPPRAPLPAGPVTTVVRNEGRPGVLSALDRARLVREAQRAGVVVEVATAVGAYVARDAPLFRVHGPPDRLDRGRLLEGALLAEERTIAQDPAFAIRAVVDVALRALSPAVNDPTTAVQALDGLGELLTLAARRDLERRQLAGDDGRLRLICSDPGWEELLDLSLTEIRRYGADAPQIARRMRALLLGLLDTAPAARRPAVEAQLARLDAAVAAAYPDPVERAHALTADRLGIGG
jgi:uncharacterized membrane protein